MCNSSSLLLNKPNKKVVYCMYVCVFILNDFSLLTRVVCLDKKIGYRGVYPLQTFETPPMNYPTPLGRCSFRD